MCILGIVGRPGVSWGVLGCPGVIRLTELPARPQEAVDKELLNNRYPGIYHSYLARKNVFFTTRHKPQETL